MEHLAWQLAAAESQLTGVLGSLPAECARDVSTIMEDISAAVHDFETGKHGADSADVVDVSVRSFGAGDGGTMPVLGALHDIEFDGWEFWKA